MNSDITTTPEVRRRTLAKGAGWAVPAIVAGASAPAMAASNIPPDGLNGWVVLSRACGSNREFQVDGRGSFTGGGNNDRGIWVFVNDSTATITNATIIFYFDKSNFVFSNASQAGWSNLVRSTTDDATSPASGYYAYKTTYNGSWTYFASYHAWVADGDPYWYVADMPGQCGQVRAYARRSVITNGKYVEFLRGPVSV